MAEKSTYIKLDRNIIDWGWFRKANVLQVFVWLLVKANYEDHKLERYAIHRGQIVTSHERIADGCGMSVSTVRRCLNALEGTGEITRVHTNKFQIITITNYDRYQSDLPKMNRQVNSQVNRQVSSQVNRQVNNDIRNKECITVNSNTKKERNKEKGRYAPGSPSGADNPPDVPPEHRDRFRTYEEYLKWRNQ